MTDKASSCLKEKYTKFRFEDSLRKYQPPPRKRVKMDGSRIDIKATNINISNRLARLCEIRKLYHATSRERASQFSRKKQAHQESRMKTEQRVSDFDEGHDAQMKGSNSIQKEQNGSSMRESINEKNFSQEANESEMMANLMTPSRLLNFSVKQSSQRSQGSYLKNSIDKQNNSISPIGNSIFMQKSEMKSESNNNDNFDFVNENKVKDIEFHIALVQQIHLKIVEQYEKLNKEDVSSPQNLDKSYEDLQAHELKTIIHPDQCNINQLQIGVEHNTKQQTVFNNLPTTKTIHQSKIEQQILQSQNAPLSRNFVDDDKETVNMGSQVIQILKTPLGRFNIESSKGVCLFSARIFNKLCEKESPNRITSQILKHHPYLSQSTDQLQLMARNFEE